MQSKFECLRTVSSLAIRTKPVTNFFHSVDEQMTAKQFYSVSLKQRWYYLVLSAE